ncbi:uncharacterized protein LOC105190866 isoform X1 [Harpegnathos saltator]|uniref:uncharacterized protein LOC105190866 isoform X1 n=2 Tax=Harpegnathos saltator TaxID=610380 RepID=UPI000DBED4F9|nr:uncharacterized protein LOC105190866 isoform X1 [Harpegnathos saltator]
MDKEKDSILLDIDMDSTIEQNSNTLSEDLSAHATKNTDTLECRHLKMIMAKIGLGPSDALNFHKQVGSRLPDDWYKIDIDRRNDLPTFGNFIPWFTEQTLGRTLENEGNAIPQIAVNALDRDKSYISSEPNRSKQPTGRKRKRPHFSIAKIDWKTSDAHINNSSIHEDFMQEGGNISPVSAYEDLVKLTQDSLCASGARVKRESEYLRRPPSPWWDENCAKIAKPKIDAFHEYKEHPIGENLTKYNAICKSVKKQLRLIRNQKYKEFCSFLNKDMDIKKVWNLVSAFKRKKSISNNNLEQSDKCLEITNKTFQDTVTRQHSSIVTSSFTRDNIKNKDLNCSSLHINHHHDCQVLQEDFGKDEFSLAVQHNLKKKKNKAPGPNFLSFRILSHLPQWCFDAIFRIFNEFFIKGIYPPSWKLFYMVFIPKTHSVKLRPISLSNSFLKIFESLIKNRLEWWCEARGVLPHYQNGFRRGRSCAKSVLALKAFISNAFLNKMMVGTVFIDLKGAFDNVNPYKLLNILEDLGIPYKIIIFISHLLLNRNILGYFGGHFLGSRIGSLGVPQGSVLSPLLFDLYIANIHSGLDDSVEIMAYADDLVIFTKNKDTHSISSYLNANLRILNVNLSRLDLSLYREDKLMYF